MSNLIRHISAPLVPLLLAILAATTVGMAGPHARAQQPQQQDTRRVLVIPVNLPGRAAVVVDRAQIAQALYGAQDSVASRYRTLSYGKVKFVGSQDDVADPVTLAEPADFCTSGLARLADAAKDAVERPGIALGGFQHFVFVIPQDAPCWWTGLGDIGGNRVWVKATTAKALQHELGHNLGMNHAVNWQNSDAEGSDFMGSGAASLNAPHVIEMGWLKDHPEKVITLTAAADVTLEALEADPRQSTVAKVAIVRPGAGGNTYVLSYRASSTANPLAETFTRGLNIHIADPARRSGALTYFVTSLTDGASYSDGPMVVRQLSHSEGGLISFHISFSGTGLAMPAGPPPAPPGTVQNLASGKCLDLPQGKTADGTPTIQYDCRGGTNQLWDIVAAGEDGYRIVSRLSNKCIGTDPSGAAAGAAIVQSQCVGSAMQLWARNGDGNAYVLRNVANRLCLDVPGASTANGAKPIAWTCNGGTNQTWRYTSPVTP
jgi:hypothetical protein